MPVVAVRLAANRSSRAGSQSLGAGDEAGRRNSGDGACSRALAVPVVTVGLAADGGSRTGTKRPRASSITVIMIMVVVAVVASRGCGHGGGLGGGRRSGSRSGGLSTGAVPA